MGVGRATKKALAKTLPQVSVAGVDIPVLGVGSIAAGRERRSQKLTEERGAENQKRALQAEAERAARAEAAALEAEESLREQQKAKRRRTTFAGAGERENIFRRTLGGSSIGRQTLG